MHQNSPDCHISATVSAATASTSVLQVSLHVMSFEMKCQCVALEEYLDFQSKMIKESGIYNTELHNEPLHTTHIDHKCKYF